MTMRQAIGVVVVVAVCELEVVYLHFREVHELQMLFDQCVLTLNQVRP